MNGVLVDTSVWVDHFRQHNEGLAGLLTQDRVLSHPMVLGELACGTPPARTQTLSDISMLQTAQQTSFHETMDFVERERLYGLGCGLVDIMVLASALITPGAALWTLDKRLSALAKRFGIQYRAPVH